MYPEVLGEPSPLRGRLSRHPIPEFGRAEATRRLLRRAAAENPYPHCPRCGRALLALTRTRFACPDAHVTITLPPRRRGFWRWVLLAFSHGQVGVNA